MNILWITLESILPANSGGRLGVFKRVEQVAKTENVYLFYTYDKEEEIQYAEQLKQYCIEVYPYSRSANKLHAIKRIANYPYTVSSREIAQMKKDIKDCIRKNKIDLINVDFPHMVVNLLDLNIDIPIVLNEHNIEWKVYKTIAKSQNDLIKKVLYWFDSYRLKKFEEMLFKKIKFTKVTFVSSVDMDSMIKSGVCKPSQGVLIPVGADKREISEDSTHKGCNIIFVGKMSYGPNIEAVTWFAKDIFPEILKAEPGAAFYIVGKDPANQVKSLASENIVVTGVVDSVDEYYDMADLVVLPLMNGGGVKVKLLEALSFKKKIISTSVGVEGTIYSDGASIPVTDNTQNFADLCINALKDEYSDRFKKAYEIFVDNYTWDIIGEKYIKMFESIRG